MKRQKRFWLILSIVIIWISAFMIHHLFQQRKMVQYFEVNNEYSNNDSLLCCLQNFKVNNEINGCKITKKEDAISELDSLIGGQASLILRITDMHCSACVNFELDMIDKWCRDIKMNFVILGSFSNVRSKKIYQQKNKVNYKFCTLPYDLLPEKIEQLNTPYYFILSSNRRMTDFFIPEKIFPNLTVNYLRNAKRILLDKDESL